VGAFFDGWGVLTPEPSIVSTKYELPVSAFETEPITPFLTSVNIAVPTVSYVQTFSKLLYS